jgi:O-antigen ligase
VTARDRTAAVIALGALLFGCFAVGGAFRWTVAVMAGLSLAAAIPYVRSRRLGAPTPHLLMFLGLAIGLTAIQVVPLPAAMVQLVSPGKYALVSQNAAALGEGTPSFIALSYAPAATLVELAKLVGYFAFAFVCMRLAHSKTGRHYLISAAALVGIAFAFTALGHEAIGATKLFGVYEPTSPPKLITPLLNENHLAALLAFSVPLSLGLAVYSRGIARMAWVCGAVVCCGTGLLTESRSGAVAVVIGVIMFVLLVVVQRRRHDQPGLSKLSLSVKISVGVVGLCLMVLLGALTAGGVANELGATSRAELADEGSKVQVWRSSSDLIKKNPWVGVGRGAFPHAFTRIQRVGSKTYSHVENEYLQGAVDWGVPGAALLAIALLLVAMAAVRRWRMGYLEAAALAGLGAVAIQNVADFNLELPGMALPVLAVLATLLPADLKQSRAGAKRARIKRIASIAAGAIVVGLSATSLGTPARTDGEMLKRLVRSDDPADHVAAVERGRHLMKRHPSDFVIVGLTAQAMFRQRDPTAVPVINRALMLHPRNSGLHHLAAQLLASSNTRDQALIEYALALTNTHDAIPIVDDLLSRFREPEQAARGLPLDPKMTPRLIGIVAMRSGPTALAYAHRYAEARTDDPDAHRLLAENALRQKQPSTAVTAALAAYELRRSANAALLLSRAYQADGSGLKGISLLAEEAATSRERGEKSNLFKLLALQGELLHRSGQTEQAKQQLLAAIADGVGARAEIARAHRTLAKIEESLGNRHQADWHRKRALEMGGD